MKHFAPARSGGSLLAFAVAALGIATFAAMDVLMKGLVIAIGVYQALLWRSLAGAILSGALYAGVRTPWPGRAAWRLHLVRGVITAVMALLFFWGLARVPMAQAIALAFIAPIMALVLSATMLGERVGRSAILASAVAFAGVLVIVAGQAQAALGKDALLGIAAVLASAVCYAFNIVLMRAQAQVAGPIEVAFWQSVIVLACLVPAAPWLATLPDARHAPALALAAAFATVSLLLLSWAYARGEASFLAPTEYTNFIWASLFGWLVFAEPLSGWTLAGAAFIVAGCVIATRGRASPIPASEAAP